MKQLDLFGHPSERPARRHRGRRDATSGTFTRSPNELWRSQLSAGLVRLYQALLFHARDRDVCFPRQAVLAELLGVSERTVRRWVAELVERRLIAVVQRGLRQANRYMILPIAGANLGDLRGPGIVKNDALDRTPMSGLDRTPMSGLDRTPMSGPLKEEIEELEVEAPAATPADAAAAEIGVLLAQGLPLSAARQFVAKEPGLAPLALDCLLEAESRARRLGRPPPQPPAFLLGCLRDPERYGLERLQCTAGRCRWQRPRTAADQRAAAAAAQRSRQATVAASLAERERRQAELDRRLRSECAELWRVLPPAEQEAIRTRVLRSRPALGAPQRRLALDAACVSLLVCQQHHQATAALG